MATFTTYACVREHCIGIGQRFDTNITCTICSDSDGATVLCCHAMIQVDVTTDRPKHNRSVTTIVSH